MLAVREPLAPWRPLQAFASAFGYGSAVAVDRGSDPANGLTRCHRHWVLSPYPRLDYPKGPAQRGP